MRNRNLLRIFRQSFLEPLWIWTSKKILVRFPNIPLSFSSVLVRHESFKAYLLWFAFWCASEVNGEVNTGEGNFLEINRQGLKRGVLRRTCECVVVFWGGLPGIVSEEAREVRALHITPLGIRDAGREFPRWPPRTVVCYLGWPWVGGAETKRSVTLELWRCWPAGRWLPATEGQLGFINSGRNPGLHLGRLLVN